MALIDTFSRRKRRAAGGGSDVYQYNEVSEKLRVQFVQIFNEAMGNYYDSTYSFEAQK